MLAALANRASYYVHRQGRKPFGLIADFRIYARSLPDTEARGNKGDARRTTVVHH